jgi:hypothetical protein
VFLRRKFQRVSFVTDYFALLGEPRQPWLDEEALKTRFFALSGSKHPDRAQTATERSASNESYTELNAAFNCLREPRDRLRHLLDLETGRKPASVQQVPGDLIDLFFQVGQLCREADEFLKRKAAVTSPLLVVDLFEQGQQIGERLITFRQSLTGRQEQLYGELKLLNPDWRSKLPRLEEIYQTLGYLNRWSGQLQERVVQLAM